MTGVEKRGVSRRDFLKLGVAVGGAVAADRLLGLRRVEAAASVGYDWTSQITELTSNIVGKPGFVEELSRDPDMKWIADAAKKTLAGVFFPKNVVSQGLTLGLEDNSRRVLPMIVVGGPGKAERYVMFGSRIDGKFDLIDPSNSGPSTPAIKYVKVEHYLDNNPAINPNVSATMRPAWITTPGDVDGRFALMRKAAGNDWILANPLSYGVQYADIGDRQVAVNGGRPILSGTIYIPEPPNGVNDFQPFFNW